MLLMGKLTIPIAMFNSYAEVPKDGWFMITQEATLKWGNPHRRYE